ncbi:hypothetical protein KKI93_23240 [Xenorhabdus bovienii]|uniref:hypothetical protein n=1 Tax=Xenorhabdus bovienii TaxID=40576 RepID=UPI0023B20FF4|nr:hypothetical protein [Xenorhabdus bovienii]MDE9566822.1 hypothetical protein [Xenorhabdus bovienii]
MGGSEIVNELPNGWENPNGYFMCWTNAINALCFSVLLERKGLGKQTTNLASD